LKSPLNLDFENQVLLGLGIATLVAASGTPAVTVGNVNGVRVAGILLEAGTEVSDSLLEWGLTDQRFAGSAANPGVLSDVFARVGGPAKYTPAQAKTMVRINSGHVIIDNAWFWRADHLEGGGLVKDGENPCEVGAVINGDDVTAYGLKVEHALTDQVQWNGNRGKTFMFQGEMPYDVTQANFGDKGYTGYRVGSNVTEHVGHGIGVYHFFRDYAVTAKSAIVAPVSLEGSFESPLAVFLNGKGVVKHVLNDKGNQTAISPTSPTAAIPAWYCGSPALPAHSSNGTGTCKVGDPVMCPGTKNGCAGNSCCADGSTCPSAEELFGCCPQPKKADCVKPGAGPSPPSPPSIPSPPTPALSLLV